MATLEFPSAVFPGRPTLELELPEGWQAVPAASTLGNVALAALRPLPDDEFKANIVVSIDETTAGHTVQTDLDGVAATASERRDGVAGEPYVRTIAAVTFFGRDLSFVDAVAGTLLTSTLFGFVRRDVDGGLVRVTVTATIGAANRRADYAAVHAIIDDLRLTPAPGTSALIDDSR